MNHMFTLHGKDFQVFLPIDSVLKDDDDPPNTNKSPDHPYNTRSKDKHNVTNNPEATMHFIQNYSKKEGQSETEFLSEQVKHREKLSLKKQQEEATKRQEKQIGVPGKDFDMYKINVDEQKRLYEQAQRASKQGGEGHHQPQRYQQGSSVDPTGHGHHAGQNPFYGSQAPQHQNQQPYYHQGSDVGPTGYEQNIRQQQFYGSQVSQHQSEQPGYYQSPKVDLTGFGQNVARQQQQFYDSQVPQHQSQQLNYDLELIKSLPHSNPFTTQMAHIPRAEIWDDPSYFPATGMLHSYFKLYVCLVVCDFIECLIHCDNSDMAL